MSVEVKQDIFGNPFLWIPPDAQLSEVPSPYQEFLRDEHREAFTDTTEYFAHLAEICALDGMNQWFADMAKAGHCGLQVHPAAMWRGGRADVIVRGLLSRGRSHSDFRLQTVMRPEIQRLPSPLRMVYELIDGTIELEPGEAGGIQPTDNLYLDYLGSESPIEAGTPPELLESPVFYSNPCSDTLVAHGGKAYWYLHEMCGFREAGDLAEVVSGYFHATLDGRKWLDDPYAKH